MKFVMSGKPIVSQAKMYADIAEAIRAQAPPVINNEIVVPPVTVPAPVIEVRPEIKVIVPDPKPISWLFRIRRDRDGRIDEVDAEPGGKSRGNDITYG